MGDCRRALRKMFEIANSKTSKNFDDLITKLDTEKENLIGKRDKIFEN